MRRLSISLGPDFRVDVLAIIAQRAILCCNSGAGKSHAVRLLVEKIEGRAPFHLVDSEGEFYTLRPYVDAVLVACGGDIEPRPENARALAQKLHELQVSVILDLSGLSTVERLEFVAEYLQGLLDAPQDTWHQALVIVDEAHHFCPQTISAGDAEISAATQRSRRAVIRLMDSGRKRGLGAVLCTQRLAKIAKSAADECNNKMLGRFAGDTDVRRVVAQLGLERAAQARIQSLRPGEFYVQGPAFEKPGTTLVRTYAETKTQEPKPGQVVPAAKPSAQISRILRGLAKLPAPAPAPAPAARAAAPSPAPAPSELVALRSEVTRLRGELAQLRAAAPSAAALDEARAAGELGERTRARQILERALQEIGLAGAHAKGRARPPAAAPAPSARRRPSSAELPDTAPARRPRPAPAPTPATNGDLPFAWDSAPGRVLTVLLQLRDRSGALVPVKRVCALAQLHPRKSTFRNAITDLRKHGLVDGGGVSGLAASAYAVQHYQRHVPQLPRGEQLIGALRERLSLAPGRIYEALVQAGGRLSRAEAAARAGMNLEKSTFRNALTELRTKGVAKTTPADIILEDHVMHALGGST